MIVIKDVMTYLLCSIITLIINIRVQAIIKIIVFLLTRHDIVPAIKHINKLYHLCLFKYVRNLMNEGKGDRENYFTLFLVDLVNEKFSSSYIFES